MIQNSCHRKRAVVVVVVVFVVVVVIDRVPIAFAGAVAVDVVEPALRRRHHFRSVGKSFIVEIHAFYFIRLRFFLGSLDCS